LWVRVAILKEIMRITFHIWAKACSYYVWDLSKQGQL
jgi:hypothetical protein